MKWIAFLFLTLAFAGCAEEAPEPSTDLPPGATEDDPQLQGWVSDQTLFFLEDVQIEVLDTAQTVATDSEGHFELEGLPTDVPILLVASKTGFISASKQVILVPDIPVMLNFTLESVPVKQPYFDRVPFTGFIDCESKAVIEDDEFPIDCGSDNQNVWEFNVKEDLAGAIIEIGWTSGTSLADGFYARLETLGFGDQNIVISETTGTSVLRLQVANAVATKYYTEPGTMRLTVEVRPDNEANEAGIGVGAAFNQEFDVVASLFYVEGPPPGYTAA